MIIGIAGKAQAGKDTIGEIIQYLQYNLDHGTNISFADFQIYSLGYNNKWQIKKFAYKVKQILSLLTGIPVEDFEKEEVKNSYLGEEWNQYYCKIILSTGGVRQSDLVLSQEECAKYAVEYIEYLEKNNLKVNISEVQTVEVNTTIRQALQWIGTDLFRDKFHPQTWVNALMSDYKAEVIDYVDNADIQIPLGEGDYGSMNYPNWIITDCRFPNETQAILDRNGILIRVNRPCIQCNGLGYHKLDCSVGLLEHSSEKNLDDYKEFHYIIDNNSTIEDLIQTVKLILTELNII